jgi:DNA polymerase (family 10)
MRYGVATARRGWLEKKDVLNTLPPEEFLRALRS